MKLRAVCVALVLAALPLAAQSRRAMTVDDVLDLVQLSAPRISPDGRRVLYTRSELGTWKDNKRVSTVWIVDADGSRARQFLSSEKDRNPAWSPDGTRVAFLSTRDAAKPDEESGAQIWVIPVDGGEATKLTDHKGSIRSFEWAKDGASILLVAEHDGGEAEAASRKAGDDAIYVDESANGQERGQFAELWRVSLSDRRERRLTHDDHLFIESFKPSPDGSKVALVYRGQNIRNHQNEAEVAVLGELAVLLATAAAPTQSHADSLRRHARRLG